MTRCVALKTNEAPLEVALSNSSHKTRQLIFPRVFLDVIVIPHNRLAKLSQYEQQTAFS